MFIAIFCCAESGWDPAEIGDLLEDRFYNKIFKVVYKYRYAEICQHAAVFHGVHYLNVKIDLSCVKYFLFALRCQIR